jgi:tetratricopeptide (TPR) repeat protein
MIDQYLMKLEDARTCIKSKDFKKAAKLFQELLEEELDELYQFEVCSEYGLLLYELKEYKSAIKLLVHATSLDFDDNDGLLHKILAYSYLKEEKRELAAENLEESLFLNPIKDNDFYIAKFHLAKLLIELEDYDLSISHLMQLIDYFKDRKSTENYYYSSVYYLGQSYFIKKNVEAAEEYFNDLINIEQAEAKGHGYFGLLHLENMKKNGEIMIEYANKILEFIPDFYDKETIIYFTILAYSYLNYKNEFKQSLELFISDYPNGRYQDQYEALKSISISS